MADKLTRNSVLVNTRYNVRHSFFERAMKPLMDSRWYDRFVAAIKADGRDLKAISLAAKCGPNYVQQMLKDGKRPTVDKFIAILNVLGRSKTYSIITGDELGPEDSEFIRAAAALSPEAKASAVDFFRSIQARQGS